MKLLRNEVNFLWWYSRSVYFIQFNMTVRGDTRPGTISTAYVFPLTSISHLWSLKFTWIIFKLQLRTSQYINYISSANRKLFNVVLGNYLCVLQQPHNQSTNAINSTKKGPFWATHETLSNWKLHHRVHKIPPLVSSSRQINPVHALHSYSRYICTLASRLRLDLRRGPFPSGFPTKKLYEFPFSPMCATRPAHLILLGLIGRIFSWGPQVTAKRITQIPLCFKNVNTLIDVLVSQLVISHNLCVTFVIVAVFST